MSVDAKEVSEMARLINILNSGVQFADEPEISLSERLHHQTPTSSGLDPNVSEMKRILEAFNGNQQNPTKRLTDRAVIDRELREALVTEETSDGVRIGNWKIHVKESDTGLKFFDVTNKTTNEAIAIDLTLYDAAHGIAKALNEGEGINSRRIRAILQAESDYSHYRQDAATFKRKIGIAERAGNEQKSAIMEDRFSDSLYKAKLAREKVVKLAN